MKYQKILNEIEKECKFIEIAEGKKIFKDNRIVGMITKNSISIEFSRKNFNGENDRYLISFIKDFIIKDNDGNIQLCDIVYALKNSGEYSRYAISNGTQIDLVTIFGFLQPHLDYYGEIVDNQYYITVKIGDEEISIPRETINPKGYDLFDSISVLEKNEKSNLKCDLYKIKNKLLNIIVPNSEINLMKDDYKTKTK